MLSYLKWESSNIDWCEKNFVISKLIAEFYNTISNILFFVVPPLLIYLFRQYSKNVTAGANLVFVLLFIVGLGSAYFHSTLSLLGQLLDEIAILWVLMAATAVWFPLRHLPTCFNGNRKLFQTMILPVSVISTVFCCIVPEINAFILMLFGAPIFILMISEYRRSKDFRVRCLAMRSAIIWLFAVTCWVNDKFLCDQFWNKFPYLHSGWHVLIFISAYTACVLFAYFQALHELPELLPRLRYWPREGGVCEYLGIPYVTVRCDSCTDDNLCSTCTSCQTLSLSQKHNHLML